MKPSRNSLARSVMLMLPLLLVAACGHTPPVFWPPVVVEPPKIPPLPVQARQPPPPPICSPTCSEGLMLLRRELLDTLTRAEPPASPASASATH
jgi:hypothetical protein